MQYPILLAPARQQAVPFEPADQQEQACVIPCPALPGCMSVGGKLAIKLLLPIRRSTSKGSSLPTSGSRMAQALAKRTEDVKVA